MYKLIIVDDQPVIRKGLLKLVKWEEMGIEVVGEASNGMQALELIIKENPHLMISDIKMPEMDGIELIKECRRISRGIKTVVLSGYNDFEFVKVALKHGVENYLLKPVDRDELVSTLLNIINKFENDLNYCKTMIESGQIIKDNILYRMLTDNIPKKELRDKIKFLNIDLSGSCFRAAVIEVADYGPIKLEEEKKKRIQSTYKYILTSGLANNSLITKTLDGRTVLLFKDKNTDFINVNRILNNIMIGINGNVDTDVIIGVGEVVDRLDLINSSFKQAVKLLDYKYVMVRNRIIWYELQDDIKKTYCDYVEINVQKFENLIVSGNSPGIAGHIDDICNVLLKVRTIKPEQMKYFFMDIIIMFIGLIKKYKLQLENIISLEGCLHEMTEHITVEQSIESVKAICNKVIGEMERKKESPRKKIDEIIKYINDNYFKEMSLKTLAADFGYNPAYLGQIFRNETGEIFTNYLNNLRLEKAKQLIINTHDNINAIGEKVGYEDSNYFYKLFKKYVGISPTRFKQKNS